MTAFERWKDKIEHNTDSFYNLARSKKEKNVQVVEYYDCHRSGFPNQKNKNKGEKTRQSKAQGSCKMGRDCPSRMIAEFDGAHVTVEFTYTHAGHDLQPEHLRLTQETQELIRGKLQLVIPEKKVARETRKIYTPSKKKRRSNILTFQDVRNVAAKYQINFEGRYSAEDPDSIDIFVQEQREKNDVIILSYKKQGAKDDNYGGVGEMDFMLAFMTPFQKEMVERLQSQEASIICMDATHQTNGYDFLFVTIMTKDNSGKGLPLAHLFSNHEDYTFLKHFLRDFRKHCGKISCSAFMSDDAPQYFQAWSSVMHDPGDIVPAKLLCAWHVTCSLERNILSKIKTAKQREFVFHHLIQQLWSSWTKTNAKGFWNHLGIRSRLT